MATAAVIELRHIRTAQIDDPERVVELAKFLVKKGGSSSVGDECMIQRLFTSKLRLDYFGTDRCGSADNG